MKVTFPDGTSETIDPRGGDVTCVIAVKTDSRWKMVGGFEAGTEDIAEYEAYLLHCDRRYEDVAVLAVDR